MNIQALLFESLICPTCGSSFYEKDINLERISCDSCNTKYPFINGVPILINELKSIFSISDFETSKNLFFDVSKSGSRIGFLSKKIFPSIGGNNLGKKNFRFLSKLISSTYEVAKPKVLIIGGSIVGDGMSEFIKSNALDLIEADVSFGPQTKIIFDAHSVPYKNETFHCVIVQAVLEHVIDPGKCVEEIYRVLKPDGIVYAETPFMQQVHGGPYDFTRYSRSGHRRIFRNFKEIKSGATAGSGTSLAWAYQYFLLSLFGYSDKIRLAIKLFARATGFWIKYFDYLTKFNPRDFDGASGFYFIGSKSPVTLSDKEVINYYSQE